SPIGVKNVANYHHMPGSPAAEVTFVATTALLFLLAVITLLKGKPWTALLGVVLPIALVVGAARLARPGSPWARWRYRERPGKLATATRREERLREPVIRLKERVQDLLAGSHDQAVGGVATTSAFDGDPAGPDSGAPGMRRTLGDRRLRPGRRGPQRWD